MLDYHTLMHIRQLETPVGNANSANRVEVRSRSLISRRCKSAAPTKICAVTSTIVAATKGRVGVFAVIRRLGAVTLNTVFS
jgi:hypothetical protein